MRNREACYAPLAALRLPEGCELFLSVIHHDDRDDDRGHIATTTRTVSDFGIATECGWGRGGPACSTAAAPRWSPNDPRLCPPDSNKTVAGQPGVI